MSNATLIQIETGPHLHSANSTSTIMRHVFLALLPVVAGSVYVFGLSALALIITTTISAVLSEAVFAKLAGRSPMVQLSDWSAALTGLLLALSLPPGLPLWMGALGGFVAIGLGKALFGGLGQNPFNPALVGRAFLQAAFPVSLASWLAPGTTGRFLTMPKSVLTFPFMEPDYVDALSGATPLSARKFDGEVLDQLGDILLLFRGDISGSTGETSAALILIGGAYLAFRRMLDWRIPAGILGTVAVLSFALQQWDPAYPGPAFMLFSGGLMLGAVYMATDMVTSPVTTRGVWLYGILIGSLTVVIRIWGGLAEGVMYAILLGNACSPLLDRFNQPKVFGSNTKRD